MDNTQKKFSKCIADFGKLVREYGQIVDQDPDEKRQKAFGQKIDQLMARTEAVGKEMEKGITVGD